MNADKKHPAAKDKRVAGKWTPAPWAYVPELDSANWTDGREIGSGVRPSCSLVARTYRGYGETMEVANAYLIAAAPELYEALEGCLGALRKILLRDPMLSFCSDCRDTPFEAMQKQLAPYVAALAKARGELYGEPSRTEAPQIVPDESESR